MALLPHDLTAAERMMSLNLASGDGGYYLLIDCDSALFEHIAYLASLHLRTQSAGDRRLVEVSVELFNQDHASLVTLLLPLATDPVPDLEFLDQLSTGQSLDIAFLDIGAGELLGVRAYAIDDRSAALALAAVKAAE